MKFIIANLKNFTLSHDIIVMDENNNAQYKQISSMKDITENIVEQCYRNNTTKVKLIGNKKYAKKIEQDIRSLGLAKYELNIDIEII